MPRVRKNKQKKIMIYTGAEYNFARSNFPTPRRRRFIDQNNTSHGVRAKSVRT